MKWRNALISAAVVLLLGGVIYLWLPFRTIRQLHPRYLQAQRGMSIEEIKTLMADDRGRASKHWVPMWDDEQLSPAESERIVSALWFSVPTFFLGVSFEFTFDRDGRLVGRHKYD